MHLISAADGMSVLIQSVSADLGTDRLNETESRQFRLIQVVSSVNFTSAWNALKGVPKARDAVDSRKKADPSQRETQTVNLIENGPGSVD